MWLQREITLPAKASITLNENADFTVRTDMEKHFNVLAPENAPYYEHTHEGSDTFII